MEKFCCFAEFSFVYFVKTFLVKFIRSNNFVLSNGKGFKLQFQEFEPIHPIFWAYNLNFEKKNTLTIKIFTPYTAAFYLRINPIQVQINFCQIQTNPNYIHINLCQAQINLNQIQNNLCQIQINLSQIQINPEMSI